jgi:replicative DNA helicase
MRAVEDRVTDSLTVAEAAAHAANTQTETARQRLGVIPALLPRVPWDALHELIGPLWPEAFWVVAAATGNGKSTLLMQLVDAWASEGVAVWMLPLEQSPHVMRLYWAALARRLDPQRVLENDWAHLPSGAEAAVREHLAWQAADTGGARLLRFSDAPRVGEREIQEQYAQAFQFGAQVVVIDHLHRLDLSGANPHAMLVRLCQCLKELAKAYAIPCVVAAQLHRDKEGDLLAPFLPPKPTAIQGGEVIRQEADVAIGLYRPLLDTFTAENARAVRMGQSKIRPFLEPNTVGVHVLKHRVRGAALGEVLKLRYEHGRILCAQTEDRLAYERRHDL